jgi:EamA domain-containing membrane protein RarD
VGLLQHVSSTIQLLLGALVFHECFDPLRRVGFVLSWSALAL